jgi:hypothetical protein
MKFTLTFISALLAGANVGATLDERHLQGGTGKYLLLR